MPAKGSRLGSAGCASQGDGTAQCRVRICWPRVVQPLGHRLCALRSPPAGSSSGEPISIPTSALWALRQEQLPWHSPQSSRGARYGSTLPILSHYLLSFLLPFGVSVYPHTQIKAGILDSAFGDIPDRESIVSPQLRAMCLCWPQTSEHTEDMLTVRTFSPICLFLFENSFLFFFLRYKLEKKIHYFKVQ